MIQRWHGPMEGVLTHGLYADVVGRDGKPTGQKGAMLGIGFEDDRGFKLYAQMDQITLGALEEK